MREILFRGKRTDNGAWVYGFYNGQAILTYYDNKYKMLTNIAPDTHAIIYKHKVIPETVGQYTGLTDKNGKRIFEGDILEFINEYRGQNNKWKCVVEFVDGSFICRFLETSGRLGEYNHFDTWNAPLVKWWVIGNIHDTPGCMGEQQAELATSPELMDAAE